MDYTSIVTAALSAGVTLVVCLINNHFQQSRTMSLLSYRLEQLEKKMDKHNSLIDRMYDAERKLDVIASEVDRHKERLKIIEERTERMEGDGK